MPWWEILLWTIGFFVGIPFLLGMVSGYAGYFLRQAAYGYWTGKMDAMRDHYDKLSKTNGNPPFYSKQEDFN